jgi:hypothetical protein
MCRAYGSYEQCPIFFGGLKSAATKLPEPLVLFPPKNAVALCGSCEKNAEVGVLAAVVAAVVFDSGVFIYYYLLIQTRCRLYTL